MGAMSAELDNAAWHALTTVHADRAEVVGGARRYPTDVCPFNAVEELDEGSWADLAKLAGPGGTSVLFRAEDVEVPPGWSLEYAAIGNQLVLDSLVEVPEIEAEPLGEGDADDMLELIAATKPGPFLPRTVTLGEYWGVRDGGRLVAMAGERVRLPGWTEVSAVCTHPDARGRGLAASLTQRVVRGIQARGEVPLLHVAEGNDGARRIYERLGFRFRTQVRFLILRAPS
jgi:ribosomal protein S18 acetylase RimI-like enzyme